jgi:hypothetical protein
MKKGNTQEGKPRSQWEQQVRKNITQKEGRTWRKTKEEDKLQEDRDGWTGLVVR